MLGGVTWYGLGREVNSMWMDVVGKKSLAEWKMDRESTPCYQKKETSDDVWLAIIALSFR